MPLSPAVVAAIDDLEFAARLVVEGTRAGGHRSPFHGFSAEFQQHRPYRAGDDVRHVDWKLLARTDRLYSKRFRETTNMPVMIVLDASASMAFPDVEGTMSKFRYASLAASSLAYLLATGGDAVGLMSSAGGTLAYLPARGGRAHVRSLIARIDRLVPHGAWEPARVIARGAELLKRRGVVVVISDFYDAEDDTRREMRRVLRRGHDVVMLQIVAPQETAFPYDGNLEIRDLESGVRQVLDAGAAAGPYRAQMQAFLTRCRDEARRDGIDHVLISTDEAPERALRDFLLRRRARAATRQSGDAPR
jgi:uncharacterized protein (DUF58 family)